MDKELLKTIREQVNQALGDGPVLKLQQQLMSEINAKDRQKIVTALVDEVQKASESKLADLMEQLQAENEQQRQAIIDAFKQAIKEAWTVKLPAINVPEPKVTVKMPEIRIPEIKLPAINVPETKVEIPPFPEEMQIKGLKELVQQLLDAIQGMPMYNLWAEVARDNPIPVLLVTSDGKPYTARSSSVISGGGGGIDVEGLPVGYAQVTVSTTAVGLTIPEGATSAVITVETDNIRWRDDATDPTSTVGMFTMQTQSFELVSSKSLSQFKAIRDASATADAILNISFYRKP